MAEKQIQVVVVTPERALLDEKVDFAAVPLFDGELGILPGRAPLVGRLGSGELRIKTGDQVRRYYVDGGFVQVRGDVVSVLTARALKDVEIDERKAREALDAARKPTTSLEAQEAQMKAQERARAQLRLAAKVPPGLRLTEEKHG